MTRGTASDSTAHSAVIASGTGCVQDDGASGGVGWGGVGWGRRGDLVQKQDVL